MSEERDTIIIRAPYDNGFSDFDSLEKVSGIQITDDLRERLNDTI